MGQLWLGDGRWGCTETSDLKRVGATALPAASEHQAGAEARQATCPGGSDPEMVVAGVQQTLPGAVVFCPLQFYK